MMKREFKSYFLLAICMLMLVAQVFPHHHHSEIFCLSTDLVAHEATATCSRYMHHSDDADRHSCTSVCVTNFQCSTPDQHLSDITPDYSFIPYFIRWLTYWAYWPYRLTMLMPTGRSL